MLDTIALLAVVGLLVMCLALLCAVLVLAARASRPRPVQVLRDAAGRATVVGDAPEAFQSPRRPREQPDDGGGLFIDSRTGRTSEIHGHRPPAPTNGEVPSMMHDEAWQDVNGAPTG